jgi:hypothetical protein
MQLLWKAVQIRSTEKMAAGPRFRTRRRNSVGTIASVLQGFPPRVVKAWGGNEAGLKHKRS